MKRIFKPRRPWAFTLGQRGRPGIPRAREDVVAGKRQERRPYASPEAEHASEHGVWTRIRRKERADVARPSDMDSPNVSPFGGMSPEERRVMGSDLTKSLDENLKTIRGVFHSPRNADLIVRRFKIKKKIGWVSAAIVYMVGLVDEAAIRRGLLESLLRPNQSGKGADVSIRSLMEKYVSELQVKRATKFAHVTAAVVEGESVLLVDGDNTALACDTRSPEHRAITESPTEAVIRGPHTGFVENLRTNVALVRTTLASPKLVSERFYVGARGHTPVAVLYLEGVVNPKLVEEVRRRVTSVRKDVVGTTTMLAHLVEDSPLDPFPTFIATERPDMVAHMLAEGHIAIMDNSPSVVLVPATVWSIMHSSEDYYIHFIPATAIRLLRWLALFFTIYGSAAYVAIATFHPTMIPTEMLFAMAASRESVPFPAALEVLAMEVAFELIREAGIRIPSVAGPTIGIVGAVVLGQAAVQASIVSPIPVVVVAIAGLGSFAIPNYSLTLYARLVKFVMIGAAALLGIPGLTLATLVLAGHIFSLRSYGVPVTAPLLPNWPHSMDLVLRSHLKAMDTRPGYTRPLDLRRQKEDAGIHRPYSSKPSGEGGEARG
jgi:spore germination protein KA